MTTQIFANEQEIKNALHAETVGAVFRHIKEEVDEYYGESN